MGGATASHYARSMYSSGGKSTFDLTLRPQGTAEMEIEQTAEEFKFDLEDFVRVPASMYKMLASRCSVKYTTRDQRMWKGGIVQCYQLMDGREYLRLSGMVTGKKSWLVPLSNVRDLYKKITPTTRIEVELLRNSVRNLQDTVQALQERLEKLEEFE